ncbi:alcohol dehydrogenase/S-(hydroxymethyl)glutathione dehydrogenase / alcohol dehydrogenase [Asanoa hainanensis]|uniref:Alcohol dehydrogenase/S-(Hydroxymethyl)glutathione dehydrogenase / alcohol dehydrogenase n=1 Tax=Asanoa hainanensis TaxID=560556 RepID=A0A239LCA4_9ACTN|nr:Zn-dependent alcohol dehydrogenase [Asanoa hainanensis]SNT28266.1 alcohol dehydrogenase/S-(hydroxymethyl)glutathione dehydrogenase / alcohol dehydrogenase [Asanoa hainanensis]
MLAAIMTSVDAPLIVDEVELEEPRAGEVLVDIAHCGVCHSDLHYLDGSLRTGLPVILGHEAAGVVAAVGPDVADLRPGDKVVLTMAPSCGRCYWCANGERTLCQRFAGLVGGAYPDGSTRLSWQGAPVRRGLVLAAFAQRTVVPVEAAVRIPDDMPTEIAAVIGCAVQTGVGAVLNTARVPIGASVVVSGLGAVGLSIVQAAVIAGATTILAADMNAARRAEALRLGATHVADPVSEPIDKLARSLTAGRGADFAFDAVGRGAVVETLLKATRNGGTTVMVGIPSTSDTVNVRALVHAFYEKKLVGCYLGSANPHRDFPRILDLWRAGRLDLAGLVTGRRPLADVNLALDDLRQGAGVRTVLEMDT